MEEESPGGYRLLWLSLQLLGFLLFYGVLQERVMTLSYGEGEGDRFGGSSVIVLLNRVGAVIMCMSILSWNGKGLYPNHPLYLYCSVSFLNVFTTWCQYEALRWIPFPSQAVGKNLNIVGL